MPKNTGLIRKILHYFNLDSELEDIEIIHKNIEKDIVFRGTNLWILMFAIIVASVGLNMNSTAVIIGAMLISPLMGPINGMGYSIATYNFPLFRQAVKNFSFAVAASIVASTAYFAISPVSTAHSELLARTSPTIYDVLIACFGGLAGIVAISSKQKGNVIPGVAIATALMPPLCTAGYGLATAQFAYFFGAIYLFTINTVFIALASLIICQIHKFPIRAHITNAAKAKINRWISLIIVITIIPSIYFGYALVIKEKFIDNANNFIKSVNIYEGNFLIKNEIDPNNRGITLYFAGNTLSDPQKEAILEKGSAFSLNKSKIIIKQGFSLDLNKISETQNLKTEISRLNLLLKSTRFKIDSIVDRPFIGKQLLNEITPLFPQIIKCSFSESIVFNRENNSQEKQNIVIFNIRDYKISDDDKNKIKLWLKSRLKCNNIVVLFDY